MTFDYRALGFWFQILQAIITLCMFVYVRKVAKQKATEKRFKRLESDMAVLETRTSKLEIELNHLPTQQQFIQLNAGIAKLSSAMENFRGRLSGINRAVDLMNEFLINQGSGAR
jgi:predicted  nucleic acid-binding Zn-ribbon protein